MVSKAHLTSHSRMSGSRWVITPSWLSESWRSFLYSSSVYSYHLFLISSVSVRSIPFLSLIKPIFVWNVPLVSLIFLKRSLAFPILLFSSISLHWSLDYRPVKKIMEHKEGAQMHWRSWDQEIVTSSNAALKNSPKSYFWIWIGYVYITWKANQIPCFSLPVLSCQREKLTPLKIESALKWAYPLIDEILPGVISKTACVWCVLSCFSWYPTLRPYGL